MRKKVKEELHRKNQWLYLLGGFIIVWIVFITIWTSQSTILDHSTSTYTKNERIALNLAKKTHQKDGYTYHIRNKNDDGTYTVMVRKKDSNQIICYYVIHPKTRKVAYYEN